MTSVNMFFNCSYLTRSFEISIFWSILSYYTSADQPCIHPHLIIDCLATPIEVTTDPNKKYLQPVVLTATSVLWPCDGILGTQQPAHVYSGSQHTPLVKWKVSVLFCEV